MTYSSKYVEVAPRSISIKPDACRFAEAYYLLFLYGAFKEGMEVPTHEESIIYRKRSKVTATVVTKTGIPRTGLPTSLVLKCVQMPLLEGMITDQAPSKKVIRPFCDAADYTRLTHIDEMVVVNRELVEMRRVLNINTATAVGMLTALLEIVGLKDQFGDLFFNNISNYTQYVLSRNIHIGNWAKNNPNVGMNTQKI